MGWVSTRVGLGWDGSGRIESRILSLLWVEPGLVANEYFYWVGLLSTKLGWAGSRFFNLRWVELGLSLMGQVDLSHRKWTRGQLYCIANFPPDCGLIE
jgi:hypothetical protein